MIIGTGLGVLLASAALNGCAGLGAEYGHRDGSRPGTVTKVGNYPEWLERLSRTCRGAAKSGTFAMIRYTGNSHLRWQAFPVPDGMGVKVGDKVSLDVNACKFAKVE